jgi:hypothetical protein
MRHWVRHGASAAVPKRTFPVTERIVWLRIMLEISLIKMAPGLYCNSALWSFRGFTFGGQSGPDNFYLSLILDNIH